MNEDQNRYAHSATVLTKEHGFTAGKILNDLTALSAELRALGEGNLSYGSEQAAESLMKEMRRCGYVFSVTDYYKKPRQ